jgi:hypothetical protein
MKLPRFRRRGLPVDFHDALHYIKSLSGYVLRRNGRWHPSERGIITLMPVLHVNVRMRQYKWTVPTLTGRTGNKLMMSPPHREELEVRLLVSGWSRSPTRFPVQHPTTPIKCQRAPWYFQHSLFWGSKTIMARSRQTKRCEAIQTASVARSLF